MADRVGQRLGNYRLTRLLGRGGFGEVYQAQHHLLQREQAIKVLLEDHFGDARFRDRFIREAQTLAKLDHPNIVHVDELGIEGQLIYLVMPYITGGTLQEVLRRHAGPLRLGETARYLEGACAGLEYAHGRGVVHLDLKPANLLVHADGRLLLSDFGLAHLMKEGAIEGGVSLAFGTPFYMAPEHLHGQPDQRSDLYALGIILYQMLAGRYPFDGSTPEAVIMKHLTQPAPPLRVTRPDAPAALEGVLSKALAKRPDDRYQTAGALLADFKAALRGQFPALNAPAPASAAPASPVQPATLFAPTQATPTPFGTPPGPSIPPMQAPGVAPQTIIRVRGALLPAQGAPPPPTPPLQPPPQPPPRQAAPILPPRPPGTLLCAYRGHTEPVVTVAWAPDGRRLVSASKEKAAQVWDGLTGGPLFSLSQTADIETVAWSPDGKLIACGGSDGAVHVWSETTRGRLFTYSGHSRRALGVAWSPDARRLASWGADKTAQVWQAVNGANPFIYRGHSDTVTAVAWSPDGARLASGSEDEKVRVWYPAPVETLLVYASHSKAVRAVAWAPDGRRIASASQDKTVQVWDAITGAALLVYQGHASKVNAVAWSPDGRRIASADHDGAVQVWDAANGGNGYIYRGHAQEVYAIVWSPDGTRIASASRDKTVQVWQAG